MKRHLIFACLAIAPTLGGCQSSSTETKAPAVSAASSPTPGPSVGAVEAADKNDEGRHEHSSPHGGALVELGEEFAHIEIALDAVSGTLTVYAFDGEAEKSVRVKQMEVAKTSLCFCGFLLLAFLVTSPLFNGKSKNPAATNGAGGFVYLEGQENPRVKKLIQEYKPISFSSLSGFFYYTPEPGEKPDPEMSKKSKIPDEVKAINGRKVAINGFMMPIDQDPDGSKEFVLNGNFDMCGFGGPTSINQWMVVKYMGSGRVPYTHLPLSVFGELEVGEEYRDSNLFSIYRMKAKAVSTPDRLIE